MSLPLRVAAALALTIVRPDPVSIPADRAVLPVPRPRVVDSAPAPAMPPIGLLTHEQLAERRRALLEEPPFAATLERACAMLSAPRGAGQ